MKKTRILSALLAAAMLTATLASCAENPAGDGTSGTSGNSTVTTPGSTEQQSEDEKLYDAILGEYYEVYQKALEAKTVSERYALMAVAEAKLLESGIMLPMQANGGNYAVSKIAPYTVTSVLWGNDSDRYHNAVIATEPIKVADRDALKALWAEKRGSGTWEAAAAEYLTSHGYTLQSTYSKGYSSNPIVFDVARTSRAADSEVLVNTYDGLVEYNSENQLVGALAESWTVSEDGLTWTFKIRQGAKWFNAKGEELGTVTADDFVAGFQHMLDDKTGGLSWLVDGIVAGVSEYIAEQSDDFSGVGVKATDDYTLVYTLTDNCAYFDTMLSYGVFAPLYRNYYVSLGGEFGFDASTGDYAKGYESIAYCGPYLITTLVENGQIEFTKNPGYWNAANVRLEKITWNFASSKEATWAFDNLNSGNIDGCGLNTANREKAIETKGQEWFNTYAYVSGTDAGSYPAFFNVNRGIYHDSVDETKLVSIQTESQAAMTKAAMQNQNFRLAIALSFDRGQYMATQVGDELKYTSMVNSYTPATFVTLPSDVTISINGTNKTYRAGTFYGQIMQDQITADGYPMKVFDPTADGGIGSGSGYDGWYNLDKAKEYCAKAIAELKEQGVEVTKENPIHLDYTTFDNETYNALAAVVKTSIEKVSDGLVVVDILKTTDQQAWMNSLYEFEAPADANYDINTLSGWGPDYGDPSTYLDTFIKGGGYMLKCIGLDA